MTTRTLRPLTEFLCDRCNEIINQPNEGHLEWISDNESDHSFKIVHHAPHSPLRQGDPERDCYHHTKQRGRHDSSLSEFVGEKGIINLLGLLDPGVHHDPDGGHFRRTTLSREFVDLFRRLHVPHFEQARLYWHLAESDGFLDGHNETSIYLPDTLKAIIKKYQGRG